MIIENLTYKGTNLKFFHKGEMDYSGIGCIKEIIKNDEYELFKYKNKKKTTFLDIGGNHGLVSIILALQNPKSKVYVLEPLPSLITIINKNIELNKLNNVIVINKALGDGSDLSIIQGNSCSGASSCIVENKNDFLSKHNGIKNIHNIKTITFDEIFTIYNIKEIELLKIDCEGGEYFLYDSEEIKKNKVKNITGEFHNLSYNKSNRQWNYTDLTKYVKAHIKGNIKLTYLDL